MQPTGLKQNETRMWEVLRSIEQAHGQMFLNYR